MDNKKTIIDSLTTFCTEHPEITTKLNYEIFNHWTLTTSIKVVDADLIPWILEYISDVKNMPIDVLKDATN